MMGEKKKSTVTIRPGSPEWDDFMTALEGYSTKAEAKEAFRERCENEIVERLRRSKKNKNTRKQWVKFDRSGRLWVMPERFKLDHDDRPDTDGFWRICWLENGRWLTRGIPRILNGKTISANLGGISDDPEANFSDNLKGFREASERCGSWADDANRAANYLESIAEGLSAVFGDEVPPEVWEAVERAFRAGRFAERALSYEENRILEEGFELADQKGGRAKGATGRLKTWQRRALELWKENPNLGPLAVDEKLTSEGFIEKGGKGMIFKGGSKAGVKNSVQSIKNFKKRAKNMGWL